MIYNKSILFNRFKRIMKILVTGTAGFIGFSMSLRLLKKKYSVVGIDNLDKYYNIRIKKKDLKF